MNWRNINIPKLLGWMYIGGMFVLALKDVGEMPSGDPFPWHLPFTVVIALGFPFLMGYEAGKQDGKV